MPNRSLGAYSGRLLSRRSSFFSENTWWNWLWEQQQKPLSCWFSELHDVERRDFENLCFFFEIFYLFIFRQRGSEGDRDGQKHPRLVASCTPLARESGSQPRHVPLLGIEPVTLWFAGQLLVYWVTPAGAKTSVFIKAASPGTCWEWLCEIALGGRGPWSNYSS